jgi:hypothetical protein
MLIAKKRLNINMMLTKKIWLLIGGLAILSAVVIGVGVYLTKKSTPVVEVLEEETLKEPTTIDSKEPTPPVVEEPEEEITKEPTSSEPEEISKVNAERKILNATIICLLIGLMVSGLLNIVSASDNAIIDSELLGLIDQYAGNNDYYNTEWDLTLDQYKAWIATIAWGEGGKGGYTAHSQGNLGKDLFYHKVVEEKFRFSTGIGPFQLDYHGANWPTIKKLNPNEALIDTLSWHYKEFGKDANLSQFSEESEWYAVKPGRVEIRWKQVTGTNWDEHKNGKNSDLKWTDVVNRIEIIDGPNYSYEENVKDVGKLKWNVTFTTDAGAEVSLKERYDSWLIIARRWGGTKIFEYYYTYNESTGCEVWVWDNSGEEDEFRYIFVRDYTTGQFPENISGNYAGEDKLDSPALEVFLNITTPNRTSPANAGDYNNPSLIKKVTIEIKKEKPIAGLTKDNFEFKIGRKTAAASLIDASILGQYVFDLTPPKQDAAGKYDLEVILKYKGYTLEDKEEDAVIYTAAGGHADVMLIIDRSGSMRWSSSKIEDAKTSAKLFVDYMRYGDKAGVVSFGDSASYDYFLDTLDADIKWAIKNAIDGIAAGGMTAMGEGLRYGLNNLNTLGDTTHAWAMVLLSDGYHNQGEHPDSVLPDIQASDVPIKVFTIGLGPNADRTLLEHIATETGGKYYYAATSDQLREIYDSIVGKVVGWQTILEEISQILKDQIKQIFVPIEDAFEAIFSISWGGSDLDLVLYKPDGTKIDPAVAMANGQWKLLALTFPQKAKNLRQL